MCQVVLFGLIGKGLVINPVALEIFAEDSELILAQVVTVAQRAIRCDQKYPVLFAMCSAAATELQVNARIAWLGASIQLGNIDQSTMVGFVMALPTGICRDVLSSAPRACCECRG